MLKFDPKTGVYVDEIADVREQVRAEWVKAFTTAGNPPLNTEPETPAGQLIDSQTASIVNKDNELLFLAQQFNPLKASGIWQEALAAVYFIKRKPAIPSSAVIKCTGLYNTVIPQGVQIKSIIDNTVWESVTSDYIRKDGTVEIEFQCLEPGPVSAQPNTLSQIVTTIPGWDIATNENIALVGQFEESQAAFEDRRYKSVALNSRSSGESVFSRVAALNGVIAVSIAQNRTDEPSEVDGVSLKPHSIYLCVLGGEDQDIANAMYETVSAGCDYNGSVSVEVTDPYTYAKDTVSFDRPTEQNIGIKVSIVQDKTTYPNVEELAKECIFQNFYGNTAPTIKDLPVLRVTMGQDLYSSRFIAALLADNIKQVTSVKLNFPSDGEDKDMIHIPINVNPVLDKANIQVILLPAED